MERENFIKEANWALKVIEQEYYDEQREEVVIELLKVCCKHLKSLGVESNIELKDKISNKIYNFKY